ncbi:MAG: NifU N-terminal domain-containing protein, partial [Caulobacterales bacterium]|nr:NifU N-terminal domain-containing protein [Caulobacterales bacterium]
MFIQTEATPNPATLKFLPGREVLGAGVREFSDHEAAKASPLASALFEVPGVCGVMFGADFLTVTKTEAADWDHLKPALLAAVMDHFTSGQPLVTDAGAAAPGAAEEDYDAETAEIVTEIRELIETRVRPAVA